MWGTNVLLTDIDLPGVLQESINLGYTGPQRSRAFLHLQLAQPVATPFLSVAGLPALSGGLNLPTAPQVQLLARMLNIP
jgi:hypothetical protein